MPSARRTVPDWSQRRTRVWRVGSVVALGVDGEEPGGQRVVEEDRAGRRVDAVAGPDAAQHARLAVQLAPVVGDLDPVAVVEAQHVVAAEALDDEPVARSWISVTRVATVALSRDHLKVAVSGRPAAVDLDAVELVLEPPVAAAGGTRHGFGSRARRRSPS